MNLLALAEADLAFTLEDSVNGFGRSMTYTTADGLSTINLVGQFIRRGLGVSMTTGMTIKGDFASVSFRVSTFQTLLPGKEPEKGGKIGVTDIAGEALVYVIPADSKDADKTLGVYTLTNLKRS